MTAEKSEREHRRDFHIGDILSVTTGRLVSPRHMQGVYEILSFMTGDQLFTHQLPRAADQCKPHLIQQHQYLEAVDASNINADNWEAWLGEQAMKYGQELPVEALPLKDRVIKDPIKEAEERFGPENVIRVNLEDLKQD